MTMTMRGLEILREELWPVVQAGCRAADVRRAAIRNAVARRCQPQSRPLSESGKPRNNVPLSPSMRLRRGNDVWLSTERTELDVAPASA